VVRVKVLAAPDRPREHVNVRGRHVTRSEKLAGTTAPVNEARTAHEPDRLGLRDRRSMCEPRHRRECAVLGVRADGVPFPNRAQHLGVQPVTRLEQLNQAFRARRTRPARSILDRNLVNRLA
jgi:hypothetical protein